MQKNKIVSAKVYFSDEDTLVQLNDFATDMPSERKFKDSGAMVAPCTIARTGIMQYRASECGALFADREPNSIVKIATLEADLFDEESIESYRSAPITVGHPTEWVDTNNAKELQKGNLDSVPFADSNMLSGHIVINDADTLKLINEGTSQLSSGTSCTLVLADEDAEYDAYKTNIRAIVESGRNGNAKIADEELKVDDKEDVKEDVKDAEAILADTKVELDEVSTKLADSITEVEQLTAKLDSALEKVSLSDAALKEAEAKISDEAIDKLVTERLTFVQEVATLSDMDITGMSTIDAKRAVVAELRDGDMKDKSVAYIECAFDIALEDSDEQSPMSDLLRKQVQVEVKDKQTIVHKSQAELARERAIARNSNSGK